MHAVSEFIEHKTYHRVIQSRGQFPEVGIWKRKQESKKKEKHAFDQESAQEKTIKVEKKKEITPSTKKKRKQTRTWLRKKERKQDIG